ncbi:MAG: ammonia-forming cytochrome c nitrite reductase subunit c552, partial [Deltaproteobacteria bacterium]|nr:ammonia-forming cytochrome c nitrite reductase subunit c552 [Deltaproteobacteria bacterium]
LSPWPFQFILFDGWGMGIEYNEPNGHTEMLKDQLSVDPSRRKPGGVCLACKTPYARELKDKLQGDFFGKSYAEVHAHIPEKHKELGLSCADCHESTTMELRITRWMLNDALGNMGKNPSKLARHELRSLVCAQCHSTYSIPKDAGGKSTNLIFPWANGKWGEISVEDVIKQIKDENLLEWKHVPTGQYLGHIRHPDFELYSSPGGVHWAAGVSCADCHMPYERIGGEKMTSHRWESPFKKEMKPCMQCHGESAEWLKEQVLAIQDRVNHLFTRAGYAAASAALTIETALKNPQQDGAAIKKAQELYAEAYYRVVWIGAENSMGFHNPVEALRVLGDGLDFAHKAEKLAREAIIKTGLIAPDFDAETIDKIVAERYPTKDGKTGFKPDAIKKAKLIGGEVSVQPTRNYKSD